MSDELYDHPKPILCTCGHHISKHDRTHACYQCLECPCPVYITNWDEAKKLGFKPAPYPKMTARYRWITYKR